MKWFHKHTWELLGTEVKGQFEKQVGQGDKSVIFCFGALYKCRCTELRLVPYNPDCLPEKHGLRPVEVIPA